MLEKHGIACDMRHGFNWDKWTTGKPTERLALIPAGQEHILEQEDGKKRWVQVVTELSRAFTLCAASDEATKIRDDVSFFQALQAALSKQTLNAYHNRAISTMQVIEELIKLAKDLDAATKAGKEMGLTDDEKAFYDALAANDSAVTVMGDAKLKVIAAELITQVKKSVTIDWTLRESARAKIKVMVKRILNKHGYPPDLQEEAVKTVLAQGATVRGVGLRLCSSDQEGFCAAACSNSGPTSRGTLRRPRALAQAICMSSQE